MWHTPEAPCSQGDQRHQLNLVKAFGESMHWRRHPCGMTYPQAVAVRPCCCTVGSGVAMPGPAGSMSSAGAQEDNATAAHMLCRSS